MKNVFRYNVVRNLAAAKKKLGYVPMWSKGSLGTLKMFCSKEREGSNPSIGTNFFCAMKAPIDTNFAVVWLVCSNTNL